MSAVELEIMRAEVARMALYEEDENVLETAMSYFHREHNLDLPRTDVEKIASVEKGMADYYTGRLYSMEAMRTLHPRV